MMLLFPSFVTTNNYCKTFYINFYKIIQIFTLLGETATYTTND